MHILDTDGGCKEYYRFYSFLFINLATTEKAHSQSFIFLR